jgi:hypothetical protein
VGRWQAKGRRKARADAKTKAKDPTMTDQQPLITRTDFVFLPITSFEKAEDFHSGVLVPGLECSKRYDNGLGGEFETGSLTIQVVDVAKIGREFEPSKGAIGLHVEDVESARSELESRGVAFQRETMDSGVCYQAYSRIRTATP